MKKMLRYLGVIGAILFVGLAIVNLPELLQAMMVTVSGISVQIWIAFLMGLVLGTIATAFAMKSKKVIVEEDNSVDI